MTGDSDFAMKKCIDLYCTVEALNMCAPLQKIKKIKILFVSHSELQAVVAELLNTKPRLSSLIREMLITIMSLSPR